jgi:hypothetical protein
MLVRTSTGAARGGPPVLAQKRMNATDGRQTAKQNVDHVFDNETPEHHNLKVSVRSLSSSVLVLRRRRAAADTKMSQVFAVMAWFLLVGGVTVNSFAPLQQIQVTEIAGVKHKRPVVIGESISVHGRTHLSMVVEDSKEEVSNGKSNGISITSTADDNNDYDEEETETSEQQPQGKAATRTVNERLLEELSEASKKEKYGARSSMGKKLGLDSFESSKTDAERAAAIQEAQNLNGVNPIVALAGSTFALAAAGGLWIMTTYLATFFAMHPVTTDVYFVQRVSGVFRNIVMGLSSLASGFFGVTGLGLFLLGIRVAYGVLVGELDPTPLKKSLKEDVVDLPNVWDFMTNKKPGRRGQGKKK